MAAGAASVRRHGETCIWSPSDLTRKVHAWRLPTPLSGGHVAPSKNQEREAREARERLKRYNARQSVHSHQITRRKRDNLFAVIGVVVVAALAAVTQIFYFSAGPGMPTPEPSASASASATPAATENVGDVPDPSLAENRTWTGELTLNSTVLGYELDGAAAPQAVAAFVQEVEDGYFIDKTCHRLVDDSVAGLLQCGSIDGTGAPDPTFSFGPIENSAEDGISYPAGTIAMARVPEQPYSQGRQFFIIFNDAQLPDDTVGGYTIMGKVTSGLEDLKTDIIAGGYEDDGSQQNEGPPSIATSISRLTIE